MSNDKSQTDMGQVFSLRSGSVHAAHSCCYEEKLPNLMLKTQPKKRLCSLPFGIAYLGMKISNLGPVFVNFFSLSTDFWKYLWGHLAPSSHCTILIETTHPPWCQFHQHFVSSFCAKVLSPKNYKPKL